MARWRLTNPHYLNVPGTEWEHKETDRETGRQLRKVFTVPLLLDPNNPGDHTPPKSGNIFVGYANKCLPGDVIFEGEPTPEMEPLDEEAEAITEKLRHKWAHPIDSLAPTGQMSEAESRFMQQMMSAIAGAAQAPNASVPKADFDALKAQVEALIARNAELEAGASGSKPATTRRA